MSKNGEMPVVLDHTDHAFIDTDWDFAKRHPVRLGDLNFDPKDKDSVSRTRQEFAEECDINTIMARYEEAGVVSHVNRAEPMWGVDLTVLPTDLRESMDQLRVAEEAFASLPAKVRKEFDNDALKFVDFATNPEAVAEGQDKTNLDRMRGWGLAEPVKAPERPVQVEVINPASSGSPSGGGSKPA